MVVKYGFVLFIEKEEFLFVVIIECLFECKFIDDEVVSRSWSFVIFFSCFEFFIVFGEVESCEMLG